MTILYFTSTGNCLMAAKQIGGKLLSIPQELQKEELRYEDDAIGLVFPVYGLAVPPLILEFIEQAELKTAYLFTVLTYGTFAGGAIAQLEKQLNKKNETLSYANQLHMQENYLPGFAMEKQKAPKKQDEMLAQICDDIHNRRISVKKNSGFARFMTKTHLSNYKYYRGVGLTEEYSVAGNCTGCGTCAQVCPTGNITMSETRPVFGTDCLSCLACTQNCPQNAIRLKGEKSEERYRNPKVTLAEIIEANHEIHTKTL